MIELILGLVRGLTLVLAVGLVDGGKSKAVLNTIVEHGVGSHGGVSDDGESGGTGVDDTEAVLAGSGDELNDVLLVAHVDLNVGVEGEGEVGVGRTLSGGHGEAELVVEDGVGGVGIANTEKVVGGALGAEGLLEGVESSSGQEEDVGSRVDDGTVIGRVVVDVRRNANALTVDSNIVQVNGVQTSSISKEGSVFEISSVEGGVSASNGEDTSLSVLVHAVAEHVLDLALVDEILERSRAVVLRVASEAHDSINNLELDEVGSLVGDGAEGSGTSQTSQIEVIHVDKTRDSADLVGVGHDASLVGVRVGAVLSRAREASKVQAGARHLLAGRRGTRIVGNSAGATSARGSGDDEGAGAGEKGKKGEFG